MSKTKVSTPEKDPNATAKLTEVSMCSMIHKPADDPASAALNETTTKKVDETANLTMVGNATRLAGPSAGDDLVSRLNLARVRKAGPFLEECNVFLSGFPADQEDHLAAVLASAGAHRVNTVTPSLTHFVAARRVKAQLDLIAAVKATPYKVSPEWIVESMLLGRPAAEEDFPFKNETPLRKRQKKQVITNQSSGISDESYFFYLESIPDLRS